jgi:phosphohistidine phosphatase
VKLLGLFRHVKSDWGDPRARDFDRPLNERGRAGAEIMGRHIRDHGVRWNRVLSSPAVRCAETIELACHAAGQPVKVNWDRRIYLASSVTLADVLREQEGDPAAILMVGHNPGLEDLIFDLVPDDGTSPLRGGGKVPHRLLRGA